MGLSFFDYISQNATEEAIKARCQFAIACCSDMIARESMDASIWYKTDDEKEDAVAETLKRYETFAETYPKSRYASWAYHFSWFLAAYPPKLGRPQNTTAPLELIEQQASEIMSDVREILRSHRPQWADTQIDTYTKNVQSALKGTLYRILTPAEYDNFRNSFRTYCERALPEQLNNVDALAIELITIRWAVRQYVARLDLASELAKAAVDWQVEQIIKGFDQFVATYLYDKSLESEVSSVKKEFREAVDLYRKNVLYPIFKAPLSPRELWRYERFVLYQEERMEAYIAVAEIFNSQKRRELSSSVQLWVENISHAHKMLFQDEFHPADPTKNRIIEYRYLPNKGIKMTLPVDKEDYPKLGLN